MGRYGDHGPKAPFATLYYTMITLYYAPSLRSTTQTRHEHWTGLGLGWIRTIANFVEFGLDPGCKTLQNLGSRPDLDSVNGKEI